MLADISILIIFNLLFYGLFCLVIFEFVKLLEKNQEKETFTGSLRMSFFLFAIVVVFNGVFFGLYRPDGASDIFKNWPILVFFILVSILVLETVVRKILSSFYTKPQKKLAIFIMILVVGSVLFSSQSSTLMNQNENFVTTNSDKINSSDLSYFAWVNTYRGSHYLVLEKFHDNKQKKEIYSIDDKICPELQEVNISCRTFFGYQSVSEHLMFSQDNSHLFIYNYGYIIDFDLNLKLFHILKYNYLGWGVQYNFFSINSSLWQIQGKVIFDNNSTKFSFELTNLNSNVVSPFNITIPSIKTYTTYEIHSIISNDLSNLFFTASSHDYVYVKLDNFQQNETVIRQVDPSFGDVAYYLGWANNQSSLYLYHNMKGYYTNYFNISTFDYKSMDYKSYNVNATGLPFIDPTGKNLAVGLYLYQINSDSITLKNKISNDYGYHIHWDDSLSKYEINNRIFSYNNENKESKLAINVNTKMFTEEEIVFSNIFLMNLTLLVVFPLSIIIYNKREPLRQHTLHLYKLVFNSD